MRCPRCHEESLMGAEYCIRCGASLLGSGEPGGRLNVAENGLPEIRRQMKEMGLRLSVVEGRVMVISEQMGLGVPEAPSDSDRHQATGAESSPKAVGEWFPTELLNAPKAAPGGRVAPAAEGKPPATDMKSGPQAAAPSATEHPAPVVPGPASPWEGSTVKMDRVTPPPTEAPDTTTMRASPATARPPQGPPKPRQPSRLAAKMREWERALPGNWLSRIGMLALFIGLGFLAKLAWVGPVPQLLAGLGCGALFLLAGHHWRQAYGGWAQAITGGGIGILYLSVFGSYGLHHLMPFWATFLLMFLVTLLAVGIALRRDSMSIAILGIVGAFLVPITLGAVDQSADGTGGTGGNNTSLMAAYILTLDVGVVGLASLRNWRWFTLLGFGGSMAVFGLWYGTSDRDNVVGAAEGLMTGIFLCFAAATTLFHGLKKHRPQLTDLALMTLNAVVYFGVTHYLLWDSHRGWLGLLGFGLAAFHGAMGYLFLRRSKENGLLAAFAFGIAIVFLTVAIPVQLEKSWMTAAWAAEGAVLIWLAVRYGTPRWQLWGLGAFALAVVRLFAFDQFVDRAGFTPVVNDMFWAFAPTAAAFLAAAWCLRHRERALQPWLFPVMLLAASFLTIWLLSFEVINFAGSRITAGQAAGTGYDVQGVKNARNLCLVALWGIYGLGLVRCGARKDWGWLRPGGYVLMSLAVGTTLVLLNHRLAMVTGDGSMPIVNYSFGALAVCVLVVGALGWVLRRYSARMTESEKDLFPVVVSLGSALAVYALSAEVFTFVDASLNVRNLVLVALWAAYGLGVMIAGLRRGWWWLRAQGWLLALMAIGMTMITLNYGRFLMEEGPAHPVGNYSFGAFAICIGVVGAFASLVKVYGKRLDPTEASAFPTLVSLASILALYALSAEVFTFVDASLNVRNLVLVALWAAYGLGVMIAGLRRGWWWLRAQGWLLALMAIGMTMITLNYGRFLMEEGPAHPVGNYSFGAFAICIGVVTALACLVARNRERLDPGETALFPALVLLGNFLVLWAVSSEVIAFMHGPAQNLVLVAIWCIYGLGLLMSGIWKKWDWLRVAAYVMAVAACGATVVLLNHRVAGVDSGSDYMPVLNPSLGAFAICVASLYLGAYVMARYREGLGGSEVAVRTVALAGASVLTVWGLSEEVVAFVGGVNLRNLVLVALWAGYGCLLMTVGVLRKGLLPRIGGCALLALAAVVTMATLNHGQAGIGPEDDWPILNYSFAGFAVCILASYLYAWLAARPGDEARRFDRVVCWVALAAANVLTIWAASAEVITFVAGVNVRNLVLVIVWSGYGALALAAGALKGAPAARFGGYALVAAAIGMTMTMLNHGQPGLGGPESRPVINAAFGGCLVCVAVLYLLAWVMYRNSSRLLDGEKAVLTAIIVVANALSLFALSSEVWTYAGDDQGQNMGLTVLWAAYGLLMMVAGVMGRWPWVRLGGLGLVSVAILKLFLYDMVKLGGGYRVAAFVITGVLLLAGGFVYHRYADVIKGFIMDRPEKGTGSARK